MRVERVSDGVVDLLLLRNDGGDQPEGPEGQGPSHGVVGVDHGEDSTQELIDVGYFILRKRANQYQLLLKVFFVTILARPQTLFVY